MPTAKTEQGRRIASEPTTTHNTPSPSTSVLESQQNLKGRRRAAGEAEQRAIGQSRPVIPSLNVTTKFSPTKRTIPHQGNISIQERRKHKQNDIEPASALSQSDGNLIIGFLQPDLTEKHDAGLDITKSPTPEIVITPAVDLENPWKSRRGRQPRSSIYSQATRISQVGPPIDKNAPPIPSLPWQDSSQIKPRPTSAVSWHTDFSDDDDDETDGIRRRNSTQSQVGLTRSMSINTTRERSEGWWNTIISPIFGRSETISSKREPPLPTHIANDPSGISRAALVVDKGDRDSRSSICTDLSQLDAQRQTLAFFHDSPTNTRLKLPSTDEKALSPELVQEQGFGLGSEYYEASWHDAYSSTPYFTCQNHDCAKKVAYRHGRTIGGPDGLVESTGLTEKNLAALSQRPIESTASHIPKATKSRSPDLAHIRNNSNETEIDEEPDVFSGLHESHSNSSTKAASPIPELQHSYPNHAKEFSPKQAIAVTVQRPKKSAVEVPAKALRVLGLEEQPHTPEPVLKARLKPYERSKDTQPSSKKVTGRTLVAAPITTLEDPFQDMAHCISPDAMTPNLRKDFEQRNAIPMIATVVPTPPNNKNGAELPTQRYDPLDIDIPRKAPVPPQSNVSSTPLPVNPLGANSATMVPMYGLSGSRPVYHESTSTVHTNADKDKAPASHGDVRLEFEPPPSTIAPQQKDTKNSEKANPKNQAHFTLCCMKRKQDKPSRKRRRWYCCIAGSLIALIILIIVLALTLTLHRNDVAVQTSFLNITGFPPIPGGISTIAQPSAAIEESRCVAPNTLWSCALPKEQQASIAPNAPNQPNFRIEIRFQNDSSVLNSTNTVKGRSISNAAGASHFMNSQIVRARDAFTSSLFNPSPAPPNREEQVFLGNSTDNNTAPFNGEATPFFISFLPTTTAVNSKRVLVPRDNPDPFPNVTAKIPPPSSDPDGTAASANLVPFPTAQPIMLYNRGRSDEHYGFYTLFDRSIFLRSTDLLNSTGPDIPANSDGGATKSAADVRCTWAQTRFLVQIWTNAGNALQLLNRANSSATTTSPTNSATNFVQPGSFPYPISMTLDRHGGDINQKMIYCYGMDETSRIISTAKQIHLENRNFGGPGLINPGGSLFGGPVNVSLTDGGPGGIDGGFGGCRCQWRNWVQV